MPKDGNDSDSYSGVLDLQERLLSCRFRTVNRQSINVGSESFDVQLQILDFNLCAGSFTGCLLDFCNQVMVKCRTLQQDERGPDYHDQQGANAHSRPADRLSPNCHFAKPTCAERLKCLT